MSDEPTYVGYKLQIYPTQQQISMINRYFGMVRYVYNLGIELCEKYYLDNKDNPDVKYKHLSHYALNNIITHMKNTDPSLQWLNDFSTKSITIVLKDVITAYTKYFSTTNNKPKFKSKKHANQSFPIRSETMAILGNFIYLQSFREGIDIKSVPKQLQGFGDKTCTCRMKKYRGYEYIHYHNPRLHYNGYAYYISFTIEKDDNHYYNSMNRFKYNEVWNRRPYTDIIGLDWGSKGDNWYVGSDGTRLNTLNQTKLQRQIAGYQKKFIRQRRINDKTVERTNRYTKNELKTLKRWNKLEKKHTNQRLNAIHNFANFIISKKPRAIVLETLHIKDMVTDMPSDLADNVMNAIPFTSAQIIKYKAEANDIDVIFAEEGFKSTQICSRCGSINKIGRSRIYKCKCCNLTIDRDVNSANNLSQYGYNVISSNAV